MRPFFSSHSLSLKEISFKDYEIQLVLKPRITFLKIKLQPPKKLILIAPKSSQMNELMSFILKKEKWIEKNLSRMEEYYKYEKKTFFLGEKYFLLGLEKQLRFLPTPLLEHFFSSDDLYINIHIPIEIYSSFVMSLSKEFLESHPPEKRFSEKALFERPHSEKPLCDNPHSISHSETINRQIFQNSFRTYIRKQAEKILTERFVFWTQKLKIPSIKLVLRDQKTRWGSCSSRRKISLNYRLIGAPLFVIDYLIVHELTHLSHMNHSNEYWDSVSITFPEYMEAELWIKKNGYKLTY